MATCVYRQQGDELRLPLALLGERDDFGEAVMDLVLPPTRFWAGRPHGSPVRHAVDRERVDQESPPVELLGVHPTNETSTSQSRRALGQLAAWFLLAEDPQRRLDAKPVSTLAHQASLVRHVLNEPNLKSVLIADEVGLGKTVEAGLIIKELADARPGLRVLYLAPAGLVRNVQQELARLGLPFRLWVAGIERNAQLTDPLVLASIHRAVHPSHFDAFVADGRWDVLVVDECHHLSDWQKGGGKPTQKYRLVEALRAHLSMDARLILMSGTPHQGNPERFENLLKLLTRGPEGRAALAGRVIYRTKEDVRDWDDHPLFPKRNVRAPLVVDLGPEHRAWLERIHQTFELGRHHGPEVGQARRRALSWRCGQALQWATSSIEAGLGFLVRQAIRARWTLDSIPVRAAIEALRPYRNGPLDESVEHLYSRMVAEVGRQDVENDIEDIEDDSDGIELGRWQPDPVLLSGALTDGVALLRSHADAKWRVLQQEILDPLNDDKVVLFAQPIETVTALARYLERTTGRRPAMIIGGQTYDERVAQVEGFWSPDGPRFLVSSRAGGEGFNLQVAHVLVHVDVPWNPMELEQRVGRVHRFMSKRTIQVHTIVVKDSREVDIYDVARHKLRSVAQTMGQERFEELFARVMSLVPPEELAEVLVRDALGPLNDRDQDELARIVTEGYRRWERFNNEFSASQQGIRAVPSGLARWGDLERFVIDQLGAKKVDGYSALKFRLDGNEVVEASEGASALEIGSAVYACGDYGAMPVTAAGGGRARQLGANLDDVAGALRTAGLPTVPTGVAHVRLGQGVPGLEHLVEPFGVLVYARQNLSLEANIYREADLELRVVAVTAAGEAREIGGEPKGALVRALLGATIRRETEPFPAIIEAMWAADARFFDEFRKPVDRTRRHALFPVLAALVG